MSRACVLAQICYCFPSCLGVSTCCMFVQVGVRPGRFWPDWALLFPEGAGLVALFLPLFSSYFLSQMSLSILFFKSCFHPSSSSLHHKQKIDLRRFVLVCFVWFCGGLRWSGPAQVTRQQQAWNASSHRLRGHIMCVCLVLVHSYHTNNHTDAQYT